MLALSKTSQNAPIGQQNGGATCFANALISSLLALPAFAEALKQEKSNKAAVDMRAAHRSSPSTLGCYLASTLLKTFPGATFTGQSCAHEAYIKLMELFEKSKVHEAIFITLNRFSKCSRCGQSRNLQDATAENDIKYHVANEQNASFSATYLQSFGHKYEAICEFCKQKTAHNQINYIRTINEIMVVHIVRDQSTLSRRVDFGDEIIFELSAGRGKIIYKLVSIVVYSGNISSGHYYAYVRIASDWFCINDTSVTKIAALPSDARTNCSLLFYHYDC